jgi:hypothetical protein
MRRTLAFFALGVAAAAGPPAHAAPWSSPAPVPGSSGVGYPYDVALEPDGTAAVAFVRDGIRVAIRSPRGTWSRSRKVSTGRTAVTTPDIAVDAVGEVLVAWTQSDVTGRAPPVGRNVVRVAIRSANGRWGAPQTVGATEHFIEGEPRLATDARGDAVLGWLGASGTGAAAHDLLRAAFRPAGRAFGEAHSLGEAGLDLRLALDGRGVAYAAWTHLSAPSYLESSIRLATRRRRSSWSPATTVTAGKAGGPQLALAPDRHLLIAWRDAQQGLGATRTGLVTVTERTADGLLAPPRLLADTRTPGPQLAVGPTGERLIVWNNTSAVDIDPGPTALYWTVGSQDGTFGPVQSRPGVGPGPLAMLGDGTAVAVWGATTLRAVIRPPGGTFGDAELVARRGQVPVLATGAHTAVAVWLTDGRLTAAARSARFASP